MVVYSIKDMIPKLQQQGIKNHLMHYGNPPRERYPLYHEIFKTKEGEEVFTGYNLQTDELYIVTENGLNKIVKESIHVSEDGEFICDKVNSYPDISPEYNRARVLRIAYDRAREIDEKNNSK